MIFYLEGTQISTGDTELVNIHFDKLKKFFFEEQADISSLDAPSENLICS